MTQYTNNPQASSQESEFNTMAFISECLSKWKWFVISVIACCAVAAYKILTTPPVYNRTETVMIKTDSRGRSVASEAMDFSSLGLVSQNTSSVDEMQVMSAVSTMTEVVRRLHLNVTYMESDRFYDKMLYGSTLPLTVSFCDLNDKQSAEFDINCLPDGRLRLSSFALKKEKFPKTDIFECALGDTVSTPIGSIVIEPTLQWGTRDFATIHVRKSPLSSTSGRFAKVLKVEMSQAGPKNTLRHSNIVFLSIDDICIERAEDILNTIVAVYNEGWVKDRNQAAVSTSYFINDRLSVIEGELASVDADISSFKKEKLVPDVKAASTVYFNQSTVIERQIQDLSNELYMCNYVKEYLTNEDNKFQILPANSGISSANIESQIKDYNNQVIQRQRLVAGTSEMNPLVVDLDAAIASMRQAISISIDNQAVSLETQIRNLTDNENKTRSQLAASPVQAQYLLSVERQQSVKEALYLFLLQKREENELSQAFSAYNTRVIDTPAGSQIPIAPSRSKIMLIALILGLCIPAGIIYIRIITDTTIRGKKDLGTITMPFLGEIPMSYNPHRKLFGKKPVSPGDIVVKAGSRNFINESFRVLRTNLEFICQQEEHSIISLTSFNPGSGKSFCSANIALSLAIKEKKVLAIDGDFRHASLSQMIDSPKNGFASYLAGQETDIHSVICRNAIEECLDVLPVGTLPPNPSELISSAKFAKAIEVLKAEYDYVLIDCPPFDIVADAQIIENVSQRTLIVIRSGLFQKTMLPDLQNLYDSGRFKNSCLILNGVNPDSRHQYGYYGKNGGYHYYNNYYSKED